VELPPLPDTAFFALALDTHGVREIEGALEFGAQICVDLGVASGGVYVMSTAAD
jgi:hypothetical protein